MMKMLRETKGQQLKYELVMIENLVPENHLLRKIDKVIDFSFINEICKPYYCVDNGRPAIETEVIWQNRIRRFNGTVIPQQIFDNIVRRCQ